MTTLAIVLAIIAHAAWMKDEGIPTIVLAFTSMFCAFASSLP
jgi:hypothetical protein